MRNEIPGSGTSGSGSREGRKAGRLKQWADARERLRHHRAVAATQRRLMQELIAAVREARWSPELHRRIHFGDDTEVLTALLEHYRSRHWSRQRTPGLEEGGPIESD